MPISYLNDFIFCPYSIYLHQVFDRNAEELYTAIPQQNGKSAHTSIDNPKTIRRSIVKGIYVISNALGIYGKIDTYYPEEGKLVESKYEIKTLYKGYYYQLWAQFFALQEMGLQPRTLQFYSIKTNKVYPLDTPGKSEFEELRGHIREIAWYNFDTPISINPVKCSHCIYAALCDKTQIDHVYA